MKSSLVILYHREPYDEVEVDGKIVYRDKKKSKRHCPDVKDFFLRMLKVAPGLPGSR